MIPQPTKLHHLLNPYRVFRSAVTGQYVSRVFALLHPRETVSERRER